MSKTVVQAGDRFGRWTILREGDLAVTPAKPGGKRRSKRRYWCECSCGQVRLVALHSLRSGQSGSCGCLQREQVAERARSPERRAAVATAARRPENLARLAELRQSPNARARIAEANRSPEARARSSERARSPEHLARLAEFTRSPENRQRVSEQWRTHGLSSHPLYHVHAAMMTRCHAPEHRSYANYGAKGVAVAPEWHAPAAFITWIEANLGPRPGGVTPGGMPEYSLDRIDVFGNYEPGNVRWATWAEQNTNRRSRGESADERL